MSQRQFLPEVDIFQQDRPETVVHLLCEDLPIPHTPRRPKVSASYLHSWCRCRLFPLRADDRFEENPFEKSTRFKTGFEEQRRFRSDSLVHNGVLFLDEQQDRFWTRFDGETNAINLAGLLILSTSSFRPKGPAVRLARAIGPGTRPATIKGLKGRPRVLIVPINTGRMVGPSGLSLLSACVPGPMALARRTAGPLGRKK